MSNYPNPFGTSVVTGVIRSHLDDFKVQEIPSFIPTGEGEHLFLTIEKRGLNTLDVVKTLAKWANVPEMAIGYAGLKDRHAVTEQQFSVNLPKRHLPNLQTLQNDQITILNQTWHQRKLPRGALSGNRFIVVIRDLIGELEQIQQRLKMISQKGVPNGFGEQRFGTSGGNIAAALAMFAGKKVRREQRSILLSAARSALFNQVLAARIQQDSWDIPLEGEVWMLNGSHSIFGPETWNEDLRQRFEQGDIHPTAPLWGIGELRSQAACAELEREALSDSTAMALKQGLENAGLKQERRSIRLMPENLQWQWRASNELELTFSLPAGCYATAVLAALGNISSKVNNHF